MDKGKGIGRKQAQGEMLVNSINERLSELGKEIKRLESRKSKVVEILDGLDDPHALIPKWYDTFDEWIKDHPFPYSCIGMIYKNKSKADRASICCNIFQNDYHVVRCKPKEVYKFKYNIK